MKPGYTGNNPLGRKKAAQDLEALFPSQTVKRVKEARNTGGNLPF